jgi:hypothetical protein
MVARPTTSPTGNDGHGTHQGQQVAFPLRFLEANILLGGDLHQGARVIQ